MKYVSFSQTGLVRENNEDSVRVVLNGDVLVAVVADGVGGENKGEVASKIACDFVCDEISSNFDNILKLKTSELEDLFRSVLQKANNEIVKVSGSNKACNGMATTLTCAVIYKNVLIIEHIGDSRAYLLHGSHLEKLTSDHTVYETILNNGTLSEEEKQAYYKKYGSVLTKFLGDNSFIKPNFYKYNIMYGDVILLCTDGLYSYIDADKLKAILREHADLQKTAERLGEEVYNNGAGDNCSFVLIHNKP